VLTKLVENFPVFNADTDTIDSVGDSGSSSGGGMGALLRAQQSLDTAARKQEYTELKRELKIKKLFDDSCNANEEDEDGLPH
jgi:hypothetical protein